MESETPKDEEIKQLIESVIKRPAIYVGEHRFHTATAYLDGFSCGLSSGRPALKDVWMDFTTWLINKLDCPTGCSPFLLIRNTCQDEETAFARLASYWAEYRASRQKT